MVQGKKGDERFKRRELIEIRPGKALGEKDTYTEGPKQTGRPGGSREMGAGAITVAHVGGGGVQTLTGAVKRGRSGWAEIWKQNWQDLGWTA